MGCVFTFELGSVFGAAVSKMQAKKTLLQVLTINVEK